MKPFHEACGLCEGTGKRERRSFSLPHRMIADNCNACHGRGEVYSVAAELDSLRAVAEATAAFCESTDEDRVDEQEAMFTAVAAWRRAAQPTNEARTPGVSNASKEK